MAPYIILLVLAAYFILLIIIGRITSRKADSNSFFIGNRKSPWFVVAFGMIGASLSGVTFISVPGWVITSKFYYMQIILGYLLGYAVIVHVLLPIYYKMNLTSIYSYLDNRFGKYSYKTGACFFILSRLIGSSLRLFIVANVLQITVFQKMGVPFILTVAITLVLIYLYTFKGGIKTIVWTDTLQTFFMLLAVIVSIIYMSKAMDLNFKGLITSISASEYSEIFNFHNWREKSFFFKQFISGAFITIVMTGLDQDMMQKNLSCRNLRDSQKNMYWYSSMLVPVNLLFLSLGVLLIMYANSLGITLPNRSDDLFPIIATGGYLPTFIAVVFIIGLIAAAYSSADSALTALTTSFSLDILNAAKYEEKKLQRTRKITHVCMALATGIIILILWHFNNASVIDTVFIIAGYTYGPLLGLYTFGIFTKRKIRDSWVPFIAVLSPVLTFLIKLGLEYFIDKYHSGYELLLLNGIITIVGLFIISSKQIARNY